MVEFADTERELRLGHSTSWTAENCTMPKKSTIPDLCPMEPADPFGLGLSLPSGIRHLEINSHYYRELARFEFSRRLFRPIRFVIENNGEVTARNVHVDFRVPGTIGVIIVYTSDIPSRPSQKSNLLGISSPPMLLSNMSRQAPGSITITESDGYSVEIECGDLQPGRKVWSEVVYVCSKESQTITFRGAVFADNLPKPRNVELCINTTIDATALSVTQLLSL
ncbi:COG1361 family protein [Kineobactrum salinum]|uniref:Uncharacterized protein n=1 Tax=Kineobactrum salinum TaxID=2708301 RepID=A0A6C0U2F3_9GAMM|nr:hypothetical protein [Kineobactrum salinum]QIB65157.1 hypothetical protein G3T16_06805 [Kineobactrum salinum]